jgi:5-methylcytosine-specific restriction enzyme A
LDYHQLEFYRYDSNDISLLFEGQMVSRKQFIIAQGADCLNWNWSWSFVNNAKRFVIFGAWDNFIEGSRAKIFSRSWEFDAKRNKSKGYKQSLDHIRLIQEEGYKLFAFPMQALDDTQFGKVIPKLKSFTHHLAERKLLHIGDDWFADELTTEVIMAEELSQPQKYSEGAKKTVTINAFERNPKARAACIAHHGYLCAACDFDFSVTYGELGRNFIHVHHINPIAATVEEYIVDPINDLIPVCPNCHAIIHKTEPCLTIIELRTILKLAPSEML